MAGFKVPGALNNLIHELDRELGVLVRTIESLPGFMHHPAQHKQHPVAKAKAKAKQKAPAAAKAKTVPVAAPAKPGLSESDYQAAAAKLGDGISAALVHAFAHVESGGKSGFGPSGLPVIAYEGHVFRKLTKHKYDTKHPYLSYKYKKKAGPEWQHNNVDQATAWKTLNEALALDHDAALQSCSWGMFQVMGFNYGMCGYKNVDDFVAVMKAGEHGQLDAFVGYCKKAAGCVKAMKDKDFAGMAMAYNGKDYGDYDQRIKKAYKKFGGT